MLRKIHDLPIPFKLGVMLLPPMIALVMMATQSAQNKRAELIEVEKVVERVSFARLLDAVAHNFAVERGMTAGFIASGGSSNREKLTPQRIVADEKVVVLKRALQEVDTAQFGDEVVQQLQQLSKQLQQRASVRLAVDQLQPKSGAFGYYSQVNSMALKLIEQLAIGVTDSSAAKKLNALVALLWMKERAGQERGALNAVFTNGKISSEKRRAVNRYISDQEIKQEAFYSNATADQRALFLQQMDSKVVGAVLSKRSLLQKREDKIKLLWQLKDLVGYGGLTHNINKYALSGSDQYRKLAEENYQQVTDVLGRFRAIAGITSQELEWIEQIEQVIGQYHQGVQQLATALESGEKGQTPSRVVKVDDSDAIHALSKLGGLTGVDANVINLSLTAALCSCACTDAPQPASVFSCLIAPA
ncbi:MAG: nitrate- and nitrite sensing domain-containing protein [Gammaproteobacteria bacterium]|jgi:hypothetical protein|nr:nitrate- and nitrite sensing domain-containing protein [Gammaproteobacteria bacterium]MBT4606581.1 nitrate- and nitrite sensing domain-containing protein [Thiotrichales bacterium]MBT3965916.1 nitrate- and nitrite sensing domain-containing protein [Gammaproteobacteria bacterium]MBT4079179.1 nitrate- and nitrite sensing domain-containing protein [Gammaproteobacteria bacterium]MBT4329494.1 nitrate- and nitrite sensing domain-containing protein [Gammaproteobacteria bacterium]